jgi:hypothetical protein
VGSGDRNDLDERAVLLLGTQYDGVLEAAGEVLAAGGRAVAGFVHNPYVSEIQDENVEPIGEMLLGGEGRFVFFASVRGGGVVRRVDVVARCQADPV